MVLLRHVNTKLERHMEQKSVLVAMWLSVVTVSIGCFLIRHLLRSTYNFVLFSWFVCVFAGAGLYLCAPFPIELSIVAMCSFPAGLWFGLKDYDSYEERGWECYVYSMVLIVCASLFTFFSDRYVIELSKISKYQLGMFLAGNVFVGLNGVLPIVARRNSIRKR